jgi:lysophospholipase L1-like esterase
MDKMKPIKIVTFGDSITEGTHSEADAGQTYPAYLQNLLAAKGIQTTIINAGLSGETAVQSLNRFYWQVIKQNPDYVLIMYGANDSYLPPGQKLPVVSQEKFTRSIQTLIKEAKDNHIKPILMTTTPIAPVDWYDDIPVQDDDPMRFLKQYMDVIRNLAKVQKIDLIDHYKIWETKFNKVRLLLKHLPDGVHPNKEGNKLIAKTIATALIKIIHA